MLSSRFSPGFCTTRTTANCEGRFLLAFILSTMGDCPGNKIVNSEQSEIFLECVIFAEKAKDSAQIHRSYAMFSMFNMFNQSPTNANNVPRSPLTISEALADSVRDEQPVPPEPAYKPFDEESALRDAPYKPYPDKPGPHEPPYEPYKGM